MGKRTNSLTWRNRIVGQGTKPASEFKANPANWRKHPKEQREALQGVLAKVGWVAQVIENVRTGNVIDGHERIEEALQNNDAEVPYIEVDLSPAEEKVILATLDPIGAMAEADREKLSQLLNSIDAGEDILNILAEIAGREGIDFGGPDAAEDPGPLIDQAEVLKEKWGVEPSQVWKLGDHRVICGDCTDLVIVEALLGENKAALGFTSPPYWVGKDYEVQKSVEEIDEFVRMVCKSLDAGVRRDESRIVINTGTGMTTAFEKRKKRHVLLLLNKWADALHDLGWNLRHVRHWIKEGQLQSTSPKTDMIDQHCEFLATFENDEGVEMHFEDILQETDIGLLETFYHPDGVNRGAEKTHRRWALRSYWNDIHGAATSSGHVASFPVELPKRHLMLYTKQGEIVFDPMLGSGTTLIACELMERICRGIELEPKWVAVTLERYLESTGKQPVRIDAHE